MSSWLAAVRARWQWSPFVANSGDFAECKMGELSQGWASIEGNDLETNWTAKRSRIHCRKAHRPRETFNPASLVVALRKPRVSPSGVSSLPLLIAKTNHYDILQRFDELSSFINREYARYRNASRLARVYLHIRATYLHPDIAHCH